MSNALRITWMLVVLIFLLLIPVQFYLAGHGAFEFHNSTASGRDASWDPHRALGNLLLLISLLQLLLALAARLPRPLLFRAVGLFVLMIVQYVLAQLGDSVSTRWLAAFHAVNALAITGAAIGMVLEGRSYLPIARFRSPATGAVPASE
jgi:hypothetical protein